MPPNEAGVKPASANPEYTRLVTARNAEVAAAGGDLVRIREIWESYSQRLRPPAGTTVETIDAGGVPARWCHAFGTTTSPGVLLYLHGGGYAFCSSRTHLRLYAELGRIAGCPVLAIDYRLAPEHPYPAAIDDATTAWRWLHERGYAANQIAIAGDSAGGNLALALTYRLRERGDPLPAGLLLMSPWTDLTRRDPATAPTDRSDGMTPEGINRLAAAYTGTADPAWPDISPAGADLSGFPPVFIQASSDELLAADALALAGALARGRGAVRLELWPGQPHVWQAYWPLLDAARPALEAGAGWLQDQLSGPL